MSPLSADDSHERLGTVAQLLRHAAHRAGALADRNSPRSALHSFGLGVLLAEAEVSSLLPEGYEVGDVEGLDEKSVWQLLGAAEELIHSVALHRLGLLRSSRLVTDLRDLVREAGDLDR